MTTGCPLFKDPAIGTWVLTSQSNACKDNGGMEICFNFDSLDFTVADELVSTLDQSDGSLSSTYSYAGETETYSINFSVSGDLEIATTEEGYEIEVDGQLSSTEDEEDEPISIEMTLDCTLTTNTELNCTLDDFALDGDNAESYVSEWEMVFTKQ